MQLKAQTYWQFDFCTNSPINSDEWFREINAILWACTTNFDPSFVIITIIYQHPGRNNYILQMKLLSIYIKLFRIELFVLKT